MPPSVATPARPIGKDRPGCPESVSNRIMIPEQRWRTRSVGPAESVASRPALNSECPDNVRYPSV